MTMDASIWVTLVLVLASLAGLVLLVRGVGVHGDVAAAQHAHPVHVCRLLCREAVASLLTNPLSEQAADAGANQPVGDQARIQNLGETHQLVLGNQGKNALVVR